MADFDFDELDKAVSGALGKKAPVNDDTVEAVIVPEPKVEPVVTVQADPISEEAPKITGISAPVEAPSRSVPVARRSSGRFMDMVHPRSDMTPKAADSSAPKPSASLVSPASESTTAPIEPPQSIEEVLKPLESPFLPDTKVEKRPLGGSASQFDSSEFAEEPILNRLEAPDDPRLEAENMPDPIDFAIENGHVDLDLENDSKPAAIAEPVKKDILDEPVEETETPLDESTIDGIEAVEATEEVEVVKETPEVVEEVKKPETTHPEPTELIVDQPTGPTSITQQYTEQKSSATESGAIFDTEAYHQPLAQSVKKKSGWLVIVWIVLLVVLGAAAGGAFYIYVLPML